MKTAADVLLLLPLLPVLLRVLNGLPPLLCVPRSTAVWLGVHSMLIFDGDAVECWTINLLLWPFQSQHLSSNSSTLIRTATDKKQTIRGICCCYATTVAHGARIGSCCCPDQSNWSKAVPIVSHCWHLPS
jgi:hypothetical protein